MQCVFAFLALSLAATAFSQSPATAKTTRSKTPTAAGTAKKSAAVKSASRTRSTRPKAKRARAKPAPSYQLHPDPERYQQIQQALADRGYFKGQVNGQWGDDSVQAMKNFQTDQKLDSDGRINAPSLTGLGLGPKHDGTSGSAAPVPPPPPPNTEVPPDSATPPN